jgi:hypothetical protein
MRKSCAISAESSHGCFVRAFFAINNIKGSDSRNSIVHLLPLPFPFRPAKQYMKEKKVNKTLKWNTIFG